METLKLRRWLRKLCFFCKFIKEQSPSYLFQLIPENKTPYNTRSVQKSQIPFLKTETNFFKNSFFPAVILEWNKLDVNICNSASCNVFKSVILKFTRPEPNQVFNVDSSEGLKFLTKIRLGSSHLTDPKFRHNFQDCVNPAFSCDHEIETSTHFPLYCSNYHSARKNLFEKVKKIDSSILKQNDQVMTKNLLFGDKKLKAAQNRSILTSAIDFLQATERFKTLLFH